MTTQLRKYFVAVAILLLAVGLAQAEIRFRTWEEDPDAPKWEEAEAVIPEFPKEENLLEFYVGPVTTNRFFIDGATINPGKDGVVRYTLVVRTSGGATNISFEGMRCDTRQLRIYASGRSDGTWTKARISEWKPIENKPINRHHAALSRDYFCPAGAPIYTLEEGRDALKAGKHPRAP
jgi:hypothetical protein